MISVTFIFISLLAFVASDPNFNFEGTNVIFYDKGSHSKSYDISNATSMLRNPKFIHPETHCYIHGYNEGPMNESVKTMVAAYSNRDINFIVIDWSRWAFVNHFSAVLNMMELGPELSEMITLLFYAGLKRDNFTLIGHSLGGQLAGLIARSYTRQTNQKLRVVWGLDPAFPGFLPTDLGTAFNSIDIDDADYVFIVHTNIPNYGQKVPRGRVDFYPNGGLQGQPGCPRGVIVPFSEEDLCSHQMAWRFWAESVRVTSGPKFYAFRARSYAEFRRLDVAKLKDVAIIMGMECHKLARGKYYLKTNAQPPYAKGFDGY